MGYYPVFIEMKGRPAVVIGGGNEATKKVEGLLKAEADVTVISPDLTPTLQQWLAEGRIRHVQREWRYGDLEPFELCIVATDDGAVNAEVAREGRDRKVWVNAADDTKNCDFILPAVVRRGNVVLAASTGGGSPALARRLREELEVYLDQDDFPALLDLLAEVRNDLRSRGIRPDTETWQYAIDGPFRALVAQRKYGQAKARLLRRLGVPLEMVGVEAEA
ncbi:MAG TPA: bifunctional precorrin-2 dehydrogenase/sirohydrochlorin ferrochelatase [Dehalococcoidia bacterium]